MTRFRSLLGTKRSFFCILFASILLLIVGESGLRGHRHAHTLTILAAADSLVLEVNAPPHHEEFRLTDGGKDFFLEILRSNSEPSWGPRVAANGYCLIYAFDEHGNMTSTCGVRLGLNEDEHSTGMERISLAAERLGSKYVCTDPESRRHLAHLLAPDKRFSLCSK